MKTLNGKIFCLLFLLIFFSISCNKKIEISDFFCEYEFSNFVAPYDISNKKRINDLSSSVFSKLILTEDVFSVGIWNEKRPTYEIVYPDKDGSVESSRRTYTCSFFTDILTENRTYKEVIIVNDFYFVEIINANEIAISSEGGWFVYTKIKK